MTDWKQRYDDLSALVYQLSNAIQATELLRHRVACHIAESDRLSLRDRGKQRFLRLKESIVLKAEYADACQRGDEREFSVGTLIEARIVGGHASVYLDEDGDGFFFFPANILEEVELDENEVDWNRVVSQG